MLKGKIDVNSRNERGITPLHEAASVGDFSMCLKLLKYGADRKVEDLMGEKPWQKARAKGYDKIVKILKLGNRLNEPIKKEEKLQISHLNIIDIPNLKMKLMNSTIKVIIPF